MRYSPPLALFLSRLILSVCLALFALFDSWQTITSSLSSASLAELYQLYRQLVYVGESPSSPPPPGRGSNSSVGRECGKCRESTLTNCQNCPLTWLTIFPSSPANYNVSPQQSINQCQPFCQPISDGIKVQSECIRELGKYFVWVWDHISRLYLNFGCN